MMDAVPVYVPYIFVLTTFITLAFLIFAVRSAGTDTIRARILLVVLPVWLLVTALLACSGFYVNPLEAPPRMFVFGVLPALLLIAVYFIFFRKTLIERLPLRTLTLLHVIRVPVELVLLWLAFARQVPLMMTFEGRNFDILSGLLAPVVYWAAFRRDRTRRPLLVAYNLLGLLLLANIVSIAVMSVPSPLQQLNFDQPNRAVLYFPYIWLATVVVPIVLFAHLASIWQLLGKKAGN